MSSAPSGLIPPMDGVVYVDEASVVPMNVGAMTGVDSAGSRGMSAVNPLVRPTRQHFSDAETRLLVDMAIENREIMRSREEGSVALRDQLYQNIAAAMSGLNPKAVPKTAAQIRKKLDQMISKARKLLDEHQEVGFIRQKVPPPLMKLANEYVLWSQKHWPRYSEFLPWQDHDNTVQGPNGTYSLSPTALVHPNFRDTQPPGTPPRGPIINTPGDGVEATLTGLQKELVRLDCELLSEKILLVHAEVVNLKAQIARRRRIGIPDGGDGYNHMEGDRTLWGKLREFPDYFPTYEQPTLDFGTTFGDCGAESELTESAMAKAVQLAAKAVEEMQEQQAKMNAARSSTEVVNDSKLLAICMATVPASSSRLYPIVHTDLSCAECILAFIAPMEPPTSTDPRPMETKDKGFVVFNQQPENPSPDITDEKCQVTKQGTIQGVVGAIDLLLWTNSGTFITSLSLSAVATNGKVKAGGSYYLISRSLGPAIGSAVGLNFFLANGIGAAMYIIGTVEAFETAAPRAQPADVGSVSNVRIVGLIVLAASTMVVGGGLKYVSKAATFFLAIVIFVILCMALGCFIGPTGLTSEINLAYLEDPENAAAVTPELQGTVLNHTWVIEEGFTGVSSKHYNDNVSPDYEAFQTAFPLDSGNSWNFFAIVALWFPACTGIMAGSNRSSELKDPKKSIPVGTLFAQISTSIIYLAFCFLFGSSASRSLLLHDRFFASTSAWPVREVVVYGVLASSLGAALQSLTSATRLLTAIATDGMLAPVLNAFRQRDGKEPYPSLLLATFICTCAILIGEINAIAPILTMCFLMCYLCVNISCCLLHLLGDPDWRPTFRYYHWTISLVGAVQCIVLMIAISWLAAVIAFAFAGCVFMLASHNAQNTSGGDVLQGLRYRIARNTLRWMNSDTSNSRAWRPQLLVLTGVTVDHTDAGQEGAAIELHHIQLVHLANQLKYGRGMFIVGAIVESSQLSPSTGPIIKDDHTIPPDWSSIVQQGLNEIGIHGFAQVADHLFLFPLAGIKSQTSGLGAFEPNAVMASWPLLWLVDKQTRYTFMQFMLNCAVLQKTVILAKNFGSSSLCEKQASGTTIDVWWNIGDGGWGIMLAYLFRKHPIWRDCSIRQVGNA
ncbi:hypothetical protein FOL47_000908 [Perkinsus chesapeaki]|uniref:Amino acid permease/ SLC12A domain-containing protein n=1 Tax=Perkinsus chesapeaki TaxID=330153 RepID=A0A7J6N270_PERCH|nr:hypothetical protein FOL47_000908 [Perkinsus chesapeaki]